MGGEVKGRGESEKKGSQQEGKSVAKRILKKAQPITAQKNWSSWYLWTQEDAKRNGESAGTFQSWSQLRETFED